jgi:hypothetical protein
VPKEGIGRDLDAPGRPQLAGEAREELIEYAQTRLQQYVQVAALRDAGARLGAPCEPVPVYDGNALVMVGESARRE